MGAWVLCGCGEDTKKVSRKSKQFPQRAAHESASSKRVCSLLCSAPYFISWIHWIGWVVLFLSYIITSCCLDTVDGMYVLRSIRVSAIFQLSVDLSFVYKWFKAFQPIGALWLYWVWRRELYVYKFFLGNIARSNNDSWPENLYLICYFWHERRPHMIPCGHNVMDVMKKASILWLFYYSKFFFSSVL